MPIHECEEDGKPGYQFGSNGACYTYDPNDEDARKEAKRKAYVQAYAVTQNTGEPMPKMTTGMLVEKSFGLTGEAEGPSESDLTAINQFTLSPKTAEDVYILRAHLANTRVDRSGEKFSLPVLERLAETIVGKPLLEGHDKGKRPLGKWFRAHVEAAEGGQHVLVADSYIPRESPLAKEVDLGIASQVSIGFKADQRTCDLCGKPYDAAKLCKHQIGRDYEGKTCTVTWTGDVSKYEAREGSIVYLGCQYDAQIQSAKAAADPDSSLIVWKSADFDAEPLELSGKTINLSSGPYREKEASMTDEQIKALSDELESNKGELECLKSELESLKAKAAAGEEYEKSLRAEILRKGQFLKDDLEVLTATTEHADIALLKRVDASLQKRFDEKCPPSPQAKMLSELETRPAHRPRMMGNI